MSTRQTFFWMAISAFVLALILTGVGGVSNLMGKPIVFTEQHAWNDGLFMMLVAIFFLILSR
jgi:hypothetical protein